jgi:hypothetical protein
MNFKPYNKAREAPVLGFLNLRPDAPGNALFSVEIPKVVSASVGNSIGSSVGELATTTYSG